MANCPDNTIDSNITGLAIAEEACPGVLPNIDDDGVLPVWYEQEPNSYPDTFGGTLKTVARAPIKANRQQSKGTTVDEDAAAGFNVDLTQSNLDRQLQGFFFADARQKTTTDPFNGQRGTLSSATHSSATFAGTDLPRFRSGDIIEVEGTQSNEGIFTVNTSSDTALVVNETTLVDEAFTDDVVIRLVGKKLGAGAMAVTLANNIPTLHMSAGPVAATSAYTISAGNAAADDTVTIGDITYTWVTGAPVDPYDVQIGGDVTASAVNLKQTINGATTLTPAHPDVTATNASGVLTATAKIKGTTENVVPTTEAGANTAWNHAALTGGTGSSFLTLGVIPGEWLFLGGDIANGAFANNAGYARCASVTDQDMVLDRTTWTAEAEAAGAFTIEIFVGDLLQNENDPDLIKKRTYQAQRTLGHDADGSQSQYITGLGCNTAALNIPLADKSTVDLTFIGQNAEYRTGLEGLKEGTLVPAPGEDAINTSNDVYEMAMSVIDDTDSSPARLFGYLSEAKITIDNNMSAVKGIGKLGAIGFNVGIFKVSGTATAYFTDVAANKAQISNADVDLHLIFAKKHAGSVWDIALLTLGGGNIKIEANKPITVPLTADGGQNKNGTTLTRTAFNYLPTLAMPEAA